jgi:hypothetical protein
MTLSFPSLPYTNQRVFTGNQTWQWDGYRWNSFPDEGYRGSTGELGYKSSEGYKGSEGYRGSVGDPGGPQGYTGSGGFIGRDGYVGSFGYTGSLGIASASFQNYTPTAPILVPGQLWFDTDDGIMSAYFPDQSVWLGINGGTVGFAGSVGRLDPEATLTFSNTITFSNSVNINKAFVGASVDMINYSEATKDHGTVSTSKTIYLANGNIQYLTLGTSTVTLSFANTGMVDNKGYNLTLIVRQENGVTGRKIAFDAGTVIKWAAGIVPTLSTESQQTDILTFFTGNKGAYWFGSLSGKNFS